MTTASLLAAGGFVGSAVALLAAGSPWGLSCGVLALGLGMGGIASLSSGLAGFGLLAGAGALAAAVVGLTSWLPSFRPSVWLMGPALAVGKNRIFGQRSLRLLIGMGGLIAARLLSGHLHAGTIASQGPAFACLFAWEVGVIRIATGHGASDLGMGIACAGLGSAAFLLLSPSASALLVAALVAFIPALLLGLLGRATPWETAA